MQNNAMSNRRSPPYRPKKDRMTRTKSILRSQLHRFPRIEDPAIQLWRNGRFFFIRIKWKLEYAVRSLQGKQVSNIDVDKIYWVSPQKIAYCSLIEFRFCDFKGHIMGGEWDKLSKRFDSLDLYNAIKQACIEGKKWTDTLFYQHILDDLKIGQIHYGIKDEEGLQNRCVYIESLFKKIQQEGYKSGQELLLDGSIKDPLAAYIEVTVSIGRFGDLLFSAGAHRLTIAKLLEIPSIPIRITVRHTDWIKFRNYLLYVTIDKSVSKRNRLYQPITHPDLADLPASNECEDRFNQIEANMSVQHGRLLDIGANLGYFCHRFEEIGFDCYAVENYPPIVDMLTRLARAENRNFKIITESVLDSKEIRDTSFDVVLALNIFHHFLKTKEEYEKLIALLNKLQMNELFFESHLSNEPQMEKAYRNYSPDEFVNFILENSGLQNANLIGKMKDGRSLYKLYK